MFKKTIVACALAVLISSAILIGLSIMVKQQDLLTVTEFREMMAGYLPLVSLLFSFVSIVTAALIKDVKNLPITLTATATSLGFFLIPLIFIYFALTDIYIEETMFYFPMLEITIRDLLIMAAISLITGIVMIYCSQKRHFWKTNEWSSSLIAALFTGGLIFFSDSDYIGYIWSYVTLPVMIFLAGGTILFLSLGKITQRGKPMVVKKIVI